MLRLDTEEQSILPDTPPPPSTPTPAPSTQFPAWLHTCPPMPLLEIQPGPPVFTITSASPTAQQASLNEQQYAIVTAPAQPTLVLAGAGSGKTHTLIHRVSELLYQGLTPEQILLITFTRKAAEEMIQRTERLLNQSPLRIQGGTFHAMLLIMLKLHGRAIGLQPKFSLMDEDDAQSLIHLLSSKRGFATRQGFPKKHHIGMLFGRIANSLTSVADTIALHFPWMEAHTPQLNALYRSYTEAKWQQQRLDYDDLMLLTYKLLCLHEGTRIRLGQQYKAILVDEYQDTTPVQAAIVRLLGDLHRNVMVVGDDAQAIFGFRGAMPATLQNFATMFPQTTLYRLEYNYRSTQPILSLANAVVANAPDLLPKTLYTQRKEGGIPILATSNSEIAQAEFLVQDIQARQAQGAQLKDIAVLFRASAHSGVLEALLNRHQIAYQKFGGLRLTDSAHIKDVVAYLRAADNPRDHGSWNRVLLLLDRVGSKLAGRLLETMQESSDPIQVLETTVEKPTVALRRLAAVIRSVQDESLALPDRIGLIIHHYQPFLTRDHGNEAPQRLEDIKQLAQLAAHTTSLDVFLQDLTLNPETQRAKHDDSQNLLTLSTIHSAKGLEWKHVYVIQLLDGFFPPVRSWSEEHAIEEERRLFYVAVTRPKDTLTLTYPLEQYHHAAQTTLDRPCRFLQLIPDDHLRRLHTAGTSL